MNKIEDLCKDAEHNVEINLSLDENARALITRIDNKSSCRSSLRTMMYEDVKWISAGCIIHLNDVRHYSSTLHIHNS